MTQMLYIDDVDVVADADDVGHVGDVEGFVDEVRSR